MRADHALTDRQPQPRALPAAITARGGVEHVENLRSVLFRDPRAFIADRKENLLLIGAGADDQEIYFSVSDEGPGIPEEERAKIFDMFYTAARGDRGGQGTGLGLAICQGMVGAHGGRISVADGIDGRGTCITLHLPLQTQPGMDGEA